MKEKSPTKVVIPLGCDCHPAYVLAKLGLRYKSLPFDWLDTDPIKGIKYVYENIKTQFEFFLSDLKRNNQDQVYSRYYDYSVFFHHNDLIENRKTAETFVRRYKRFLNYVRNKHCLYLYTIGSHDLKNLKDLDTFKNSVLDFQTLLKEEDFLLIYLRYDENYDESKEFCEKLISEIESIEKIHIVQYVRHKKKYGIWGDETKYDQIFNS